MGIISPFSNQLEYELDPTNTKFKFVIFSDGKSQAGTWLEDQAEFICHAVNNHESLTNKVQQLEEQLFTLFEHVSGVAVSSYQPEQLQFLADYIIGQAEADEGCIEKLKKEKFELLRVIKYASDYLSESKLNTIGHNSKAHAEMLEAITFQGQ